MARPASTQCVSPAARPASDDGERPVFVAPAGDGAWTLRVAVTPGGAKDALAGLAEDRLRVRLRAKAVEGQANAALTNFVARCLGLKPRQVRIVSGEKSRKKTLRIETESEPDWPRAAGTGCD
ncbi:MAG: hypothetical protein B193_0572 [Solidesulfovibrio magneticus str. Maddingley MBC34]|uniref:UPF0235 protein B193_0572 n=1 Tax=Solidesulfovibrio magneticus str. Maddingley MBC34 TaxID=1206767 RepID=K6FQ72_9BACT|nr:MAG: hypothetical protein B193_0572 [Solidesulfovibrio magneticus str. Maddingley MBC34]